MKFIASFLLLATVSLLATDARLEFALGVLDESRGNADAAEKRYEAARLADPLALPLVIRAVNARMAAGNRAGAVKLYRELAEARPDDLALQLVYADFLLEQGSGDSLARQLADEVLGKALQAHSGSTGIIRRSLDSALAGSDRSRQEELMEMLSPDDPVAAKLYASTSRKLYGPDDPVGRSRVAARFLATMDSSPQDAKLARAASEYFRETDRLDEAIKMLERHVEVAPSSLKLRVRLGILRFSAKRDAEGEAELNEVLEISPRNALAHQALAKFYRLRDQPDAAREHAGELLKIRGGSAAEFITLADEWLQADQPREARLLLEKASFDHPENSEILEKLAIASHRDPATRDYAARLFREAEAARPAGAPLLPGFLLESAEALIASGQSAAAEDRLRSAIRAFPPEATRETAAALRRLALLWETEERNLEAARALRQRADSLDR